MSATTADAEAWCNPIAFPEASHVTVIWDARQEADAASDSRTVAAPTLHEFVEWRGFSVADDGEFARGERCAHGDKSEFDGRARITIARNVRQIHTTPVRAGHFGKQLPGGFVREVAMAPTDALFQWPWTASVGFEEFGAVIGFDDDHLAASQVFTDVLRGVSEVGEKRERMTRREKIVVVSRSEAKADGLLSVVRNGKALHVEIAKAETRSSFEQLPVWSVAESTLDRASGGGIGENADVGKFLQTVDATGVITVFMRDENGVDPVERFTHAREQRGKFSYGKAGVDEHACTFGHKQRRVA